MQHSIPSASGERRSPLGRALRAAADSGRRPVGEAEGRAGGPRRQRLQLRIRPAHIGTLLLAGSTLAQTGSAGA